MMPCPGFIDHKKEVYMKYDTILRDDMQRVETTLGISRKKILNHIGMQYRDLTNLWNGKGGVTPEQLAKYNHLMEVLEDAIERLGREKQ